MKTIKLFALLSLLLIAIVGMIDNHKHHTSKVAKSGHRLTANR